MADNKNGIIISVGFDSDIKDYITRIERQLKTIDWNGVLGLSESFNKEYDKITKQIQTLKREISNLDAPDIYNMNNRLQSITQTTNRLTQQIDALVTSMPTDVQYKMNKTLASVGNMLTSVGEISNQAATAINGFTEAVVNSGEQVKTASSHVAEIQKIIEAIGKLRENHKAFDTGEYFNDKSIGDQAKMLDRLYDIYEAYENANKRFSSNNKDLGAVKELQEQFYRFKELYDQILDLDVGDQDSSLTQFWKNVSLLGDKSGAALSDVLNAMKKNYIVIMNGLKKYRDNLVAESATFKESAATAVQTKTEEIKKESNVETIRLIVGVDDSMLNKKLLDTIAKAQTFAEKNPVHVSIDLSTKYRIRKDKENLDFLQDEINSINEEIEKAQLDGASEKVVTALQKKLENASGLFDKYFKGIDSAYNFHISLHTEYAMKQLSMFISQVKEQINKLKQDNIVFAPEVEIDEAFETRLKESTEKVLGKMQDAITKTADALDRLKVYFTEGIEMKPDFMKEERVTLGLLWQDLKKVYDQVVLVSEVFKSLAGEKITINNDMQTETLESLKGAMNSISDVIGEETTKKLQIELESTEELKAQLHTLKKEVDKLFETSKMNKWETQYLNAIKNIEIAFEGLFGVKESNEMELVSYLAKDIAMTDKAMIKEGRRMGPDDMYDIYDILSDAGVIKENSVKAFKKAIENGKLFSSLEHGGYLTKDFKVGGLTSVDKNDSTRFTNHNIDWRKYGAEIAEGILSSIHSHSGDEVWAPSIADLKVAFGEYLDDVPYLTTFTGKEVSVIDTGKLSSFVLNMTDDDWKEFDKSIIEYGKSIRNYEKEVTKEVNDLFESEKKKYSSNGSVNPRTIQLISERIALNEKFKEKFGVGIDSFSKIYTLDEFGKARPYGDYHKEEQLTGLSGIITTLQNVVQSATTLAQSLVNYGENQAQAKAVIDPATLTESIINALNTATININVDSLAEIIQNAIASSAIKLDTKNGNAMSIDLTALTTALTAALAQNSVKFDANELASAIKGSLDFSSVVESINGLPLNAIQDSLQQLIEITRSIALANQSPSTIQDQIKQLENAIQQDNNLINSLRGDNETTSLSKSSEFDYKSSEVLVKENTELKKQLSLEEKIALQVSKLRELRDSGADLTKVPFGELNKMGDGTLSTIEKLNDIVFGNSPIEEAVKQIIQLHEESIKFKNEIDALFDKYNITDRSPFSGLMNSILADDAGTPKSIYLSRLEEQIKNYTSGTAKFTESEIKNSLENIRQYYIDIQNDSNEFLNKLIKRTASSNFNGALHGDSLRGMRKADIYTQAKAYISAKGNADITDRFFNNQLSIFENSQNREDLLIKLIFGNLSENDIVSIMEGKFSSIISKLSSSIISETELANIDPEKYIDIQLKKVKDYVKENITDKDFKLGKYVNKALYEDLQSAEEIITTIKKDYGEIQKYDSSEVEITQTGSKRLLSDIGLTKEQLIEKVKKENEEIEKGNRLYYERISLLKDGKVIDSFIGEHDKVNADINNINKYADEIFHTHPTGIKTGGTVPSVNDLQNLFALTNVNKFTTSVGDQLSQLTLPQGFESIKELLPLYQEFFNLFNTAIHNNLDSKYNGDYIEAFLKYLSGNNLQKISNYGLGNILQISDIDSSKLQLILEVLHLLVEKGGNLGQLPTTTIAFDAGLESLSEKDLINRSHDIPSRPDFFGGDDDSKNTNDIQRQIEQLEKDRQQKIERLNYLKSLLQSKTTDTQINLADKFNFDSVDSNKLNELIQFLKTYVNLINKLANDKTMTRVTDNINSLTQAISKFGGSKRKENPVLAQLESLMTKGQELQVLADILKKSTAEIQEAVNVVQNTEKGKRNKPLGLGHVEVNSEEWDRLIEKAKKFGITLENVDEIIRHVDDQGNESFRFIDKLGNIKTFGINSEEFKFIEEYVVKVKASIDTIKREASSLPGIFQRAFRGDANAPTNITNTLEHISTLFAEISKYPDELTGSKSDLLGYISNTMTSAMREVDKLLTGSQKNKSPKFKDNLEAIVNSLKEIKALIDSGEFQEAANLLNGTTQNFFNLGADSGNQSVKNATAINKLLGNIEQLRSTYMSMSRSSKQALHDLSRDIIQTAEQYNNAIPAAKMKEFNERFLEIRTNALKSLRTIGAHFKRSALQLARMYLSWYRIISYIRQGVQEVIEMDTALTKMSYTMNVTEDQLKSMSADMISMAKNLATSVSNIEQIYQIYANLKTTQEELEKTARPTAILSNLSSVDASTAADQIQGVLNQFELVADDTMHIVDVYDKISANIKVDYSKGIAGMADAVQQVGNFANQAGLSFEQLAAIVGRVMQQTRQEGGQIGTALKTILTRVSKSSNLADPEEIDNATLDRASKALHRIGVEVYTTSGEFREFDTIMTELSERWDSLSDAEQSNISFAIAATRQTFVSVYGNMHNRIYLIAGNA
ncbi:MAG: phage tail tape measure protein [Lachnospiraceae bacterium]|nr:phage tail tape measure protein [Lachnospiraceae bacterium]